MNYLVVPCFRVNNSRSAGIYDDMLAICLESFRENLEGEWNELVLNASISGSDQARMMASVGKETFAAVHDLWQNGHSSLAVDPDTVCIKPATFFGQYSSMFMPYVTCGADWAAKRFPKGYMNGGVVYYPSTMKPSVWELGKERMDALPRAQNPEWDDVQIVLNEMFWSQDDPPGMRPDLNFSPSVSSPIAAHEATIIHAHASKNTQRALQMMRDMYHAKCEVTTS